MLAVAAALVFAGVRLERKVVDDLSGGQVDLQAGLSYSKPPDPKAKPDPARALASFQRAKQEFSDANATLRNPLISASAHIPLAGNYLSPRLRAANEIGEMGNHLASAGVTIAQLQGELLQKKTGPAGANLLAFLRRASPLITTAGHELRLADDAARKIDVTVLPAAQRKSADNAIRKVAKADTALSSFKDALPLLTDVLGGNGPRTYLIEQVNPAELRSGGGFIGTISILTANNGVIKLQQTGDVINFDQARPYLGQPGYVAPPHPIDSFHDFTQDQSWYFADSNFFPDFAQNAQWATYFANKMHGLKPDAVIALDYYGVAPLLDVTGPITDTQSGVTLDSHNFVDQIIKGDLIQDRAHKQLIVRATNQLFNALLQLPSERWPNVIANLNASAVQRHVQVSFRNASDQGLLNRFGWYDTMNPTQSKDVIMETEDNLGGDKVNYFVTRQFTVTLTRQGNFLHHKVVVHLVDNAPLTSHYYSAGGLHALYYAAYLRFYATVQATNRSLIMAPDSQQKFVPVPSYERKDAPPGYAISDGRLDLNIGPARPRSIDLIYEYDEPWSANAAAAYTIYWQKQPGTAADGLDVTWVDGPKTFHATGDLSQDRLIKLSDNGVSIQPAITTSVPSFGF